MNPAIPLLAVALVVRDRPCLVVGGGPVAARKVKELLAAGALVTVVAPSIVPAITMLAVEVQAREYRRGELCDYRLAFAATGRPEIDRSVFEDGERCGVFVNSADDRASCSFLMPSVIRRGPVSVAVSTGGTSPALAVWLRDRISSGLVSELEELAVLVGEARNRIRSERICTEGGDWQELIGHTAALVSSGRSAEARESVAEWVATHVDTSQGATAG